MDCVVEPWPAGQFVVGTALHNQVLSKLVLETCWTPPSPIKILPAPQVCRLNASSSTRRQDRRLGGRCRCRRRLQGNNRNRNLPRCLRPNCGHPRAMTAATWYLRLHPRNKRGCCCSGNTRCVRHLAPGVEQIHVVAIPEWLRRGVPQGNP